MSQQENPTTTEETPTTPTHKGKKKKSPTECKAKKRAWRTCGLCGSEDTVIQGVLYCRVCGEEAEVLTQDHIYYLYRSRDIYPKINCKHNKLRLIYVEKCLTCGAIEGPLCPACGHKAWKNTNNQINCKHCRYTWG